MLILLGFITASIPGEEKKKTKQKIKFHQKNYKSYKKKILTSNEKTLLGKIEKNKKSRLYQMF